MQTVTLNNGKKMPLLGIGVFQVTDAKECEEVVYQAICSGYRLIDTAASYGNEEAVGKAIRRSGVPREELFVTSKLWVQDAGYQQTSKALDRSLQRLQLDYLDLYLIHQPIGDIYGSWRAMEDEVFFPKGKIRSIGVCNFPPDRLMDLIIHNSIVPAVNQIEVHPFYQQFETQKFHEENNVQMESWGSLAQGKHNIFENPVLQGIAKKHHKSVAQIILRWLTQRKVVVIPKSVNSQRITENINIFDFALSAADLDQITSIDTGESLYGDPRDPAKVKMMAELKRNT